MLLASCMATYGDAAYAPQHAGISRSDVCSVQRKESVCTDVTAVAADETAGKARCIYVSAAAVVMPKLQVFTKLA
jgi:hypothetical protein